MLPFRTAVSIGVIFWWSPMYSFAPLKKAGTQNIQSSSRTFDTFGRESEQPPSGCTWPPRRVAFSASCLVHPQSERSGQNKKVRANQKFQNFGKYFFWLVKKSFCFRYWKWGETIKKMCCITFVPPTLAILNDLCLILCCAFFQRLFLQWIILMKSPKN